ncbi:MAG: T9SS type A sorting domain-containing protein [Polaribacter sp.]|nr:T9SS type A sorting domain-containing protein [Polaribacter sp.]
MLDVPTAGGGMNIIWGPPSDFAAAGITHIYFNYYTEEVGVGKVFNINIQGGAANWIHTIALPAAKSANNTWQTVNLAIADLNNQGNGSTNAISQVQITGAGPSNPIGKIFIDNVLFYKAGTASVDNNELLGFSMYPNPTTNMLTISAKENISSAEVYSILGKKVMSVEVNNTSKTFDVSGLTNGVYLIKYNVNNKVGTAKFVKQ